MACDVVIAVWNQYEVTRECIDSIAGNTVYPFRLILVDNGSVEPTKSYLEELKNRKDVNVLLIRNEKNLGFVKAANQGMAASDAPLVCLANNDTVFTKGWLEEMVGIMESSHNIGIVNPSSNTLGQHPGRGESIDNYASDLKRFKGKTQEMYSARGFCMLIKKEVIGKIGYLDEAYGIGYFEETDYSTRAQHAGFRVVRAKGAYVYHKEETTFRVMPDKDKLFKASEYIYNRKWGRPLSLVFITTNKDFVVEHISMIKKLLGTGHKINIFSGCKLAPALSIDHANLTFRTVPSLLFFITVLYRIPKLLRKGTDCFIADRKSVFNMLKTLKFIHGADIICLEEDTFLRHCFQISGGRA